MFQSRSKFLAIGLLAGVSLTATTAVLMGQGANQPVKSEAQYFVTADGDNAHLWVREGTNLRVVGHGQCVKCPQDHQDHDGHDHGKPAPKKEK